MLLSLSKQTRCSKKANTQISAAPCLPNSATLSALLISHKIDDRQKITDYRITHNESRIYTLCIEHRHTIYCILPVSTLYLYRSQANKYFSKNAVFNVKMGFFRRKWTKARHSKIFAELMNFFQVFNQLLPILTLVNGYGLERTHKAYNRLWL